MVWEVICTGEEKTEEREGRNGERGRGMCKRIRWQRNERVQILLIVWLDYLSGSSFWLSFLSKDPRGTAYENSPRTVSSWYKLQPPFLLSTLLFLSPSILSFCQAIDMDACPFPAKIAFISPLHPPPPPKPFCR